jgi:hypothetical protein
VAVLAFVAVASRPAIAEPHPTGWKATLSAALAFGHAEGKLAALARHRIVSAPTTKKDADAVLDALDQTAQDAREAFSIVQRYGSPFWSAAGEIGIGDTFFCQANAIAAIPLPAQVPQGLPPQILAQYLDVLQGLVRPLRDQAMLAWERASRGSSPYWAAQARERIATGAVPGC